MDENFLTKLERLSAQEPGMYRMPGGDRAEFDYKISELLNKLGKMDQGKVEEVARSKFRGPLSFEDALREGGENPFTRKELEDKLRGKLPEYDNYPHETVEDQDEHYLHMLARESNPQQMVQQTYDEMTDPSEDKRFSRLKRMLSGQ